MAGPDRLFAVLGDGSRLRRISPTTHCFIAVHRTGPAAGAEVWLERFATVTFAGAALTHHFSTVVPRSKKPKRRRRHR